MSGEKLFMVQRTINNIIEFEEFMIEIDQILTEKDIPIPARSIQALVEAGSLLEITDMKIFPFNSDPIEGVYEGDSLLAHISKWIDDRYGDRLKMDLSFGQCLIIIRGDPWLLNCPFMIGHIQFICERDLTKIFQNFVVNKSGEPQKKPEINLLQFYRDPATGFSYYCVSIEENSFKIICIESYQHGDLIQFTATQDIEGQGSYLEITDEEEINRLKRVGSKITSDHGINF